MNESKLASAECFLAWNSSLASHKDWKFYHKIDFWRDFFPGNLNEQLHPLDEGADVSILIKADEIFPAHSSDNIKRVKRKNIAGNFKNRHIPGPYKGRYYPKGLLAHCQGTGTILPEDMTPFRITEIEHEAVEVNLNHPLSAYELTVGVNIKKVLKAKEERGGQCNDIVSDIALQGSGIQCPLSSSHIDYTTNNSFDRLEKINDSMFYSLPRMVHHIDSQARSIINELYRRHIKPGMKVLDLMSSWDSHLTGIDDTVEVVGLGMNQEELQANQILQQLDVLDLNDNSSLPYNSATFDVAICTVSIEYLINPIEVFQEIARVLKPGGRFIITFSDRWFPQKVIQLWTELHPYERMGLVLDYFQQSGAYEQLSTESWHGWFRPVDDKYFPQKLYSDPVFSVQGVRK